MGNEFSSQGQGGPGGGGGKKDDKDKDKDKKKWEPPAPPPRVGKKQKRRNEVTVGGKLPAVTPNAKCKLRLLKLERLKDYLLMEEEFVANQVRTDLMRHAVDTCTHASGPRQSAMMIAAPALFRHHEFAVSVE